MQAGGNKALSFGKSRAKLLNNQQKRVTFKDVAGVEEAKEELQEIIEFLKDPQKFQKLGGKIPKGVLMVGPPGTGKTLLAKAVAGEANVPFFSISGSDFVEMFVGVGASRVRDLFEQGKKNAPCIIFIDEIDAVGRHRGAGLGGGHDEREQTLNQLLVEMDGFESNDGVILMASTNRPDVLDPALLRPGRFDRRVVVGRPDVRGREGILKVHTRKIPLDEAVDISVIARGTPGFTGADLANIVNEAALNAARYNKKVVSMSDFEIAKDKVLMGAERKSMVISDEEKKITAYHEAGHTLVGLKVPNVDPVHKVTIIPRGMALGVTMYLPEKDRLSATKEFLLGQIAMAMGGRIAEDIFIGSITTGAANDIEKATEVARAMVCEYGMSELGPLTFGKKEEQIFLGREIAQHRDYSEDTAIKIDSEVKRIVAEQYAKAEQIIRENSDALVRLAEALLEFETLDAVQIRRVVAGLPLDGSDSSPTPAGDGDTAETEEKSKNPFKKPLLPPITGNNPAPA
jgi:cell division protease FtsH